MDIQCQIESKDKVRIITVLDEKVTHDNAPSLKEKLFLEIADGNNQLILDLHRVKDMDSSGLGALLFGKRQANNSGGDLVLVGASENVQTIIRIAQLSRVFEIFPTLEEAIQFFKEQ